MFFHCTGAEGIQIKFLCSFEVNESYITDDNYKQRNTPMRSRLVFFSAVAGLNILGGAQHERRRRELLGGSGGMPPGDFYI